jgi:hypothetical protein
VVAESFMNVAGDTEMNFSYIEINGRGIIR